MLTPPAACRHCGHPVPDPWCQVCGTPQQAPADPPRRFFIGPRECTEGMFLGQFIAVDLPSLRYFRIVPAPPIASPTE